MIKFKLGANFCDWPLESRPPRVLFRLAVRCSVPFANWTLECACSFLWLGLDNWSLEFTCSFCPLVLRELTSSLPLVLRIYDLFTHWSLRCTYSFSPQVLKIYIYLRSLWHWSLEVTCPFCPVLFAHLSLEFTCPFAHYDWSLEFTCSFCRLVLRIYLSLLPIMIGP